MSHSNISPSQAKRFFGCPGSVQAQTKVSEKLPSHPAGLEGTAIHELAAICMTEDVNPYDLRGTMIEVKDNFGDVHEYEVNDDFAFTVDMYRNVIEGILEAHGLSPRALQIETKFNLPEIDPKARGTVDCSFVAEGTLYVIDLKSGRGIVVDPEDNKQAMYYAIRPYLDAKMFISKVKIGIIQPRAKEGDLIKFWETTPERMERFIEELKQAIARTREEDPAFVPGDYCHFCDALSVCPAQQKELVETVEEIAPQIAKSLPTVTELSPEQIGKALPALEVLEGYLKQLKRYAFVLAKDGKDIPGYSLSKSSKHRRWKDEQAVVQAFGKKYGDELWKKPKFKSPAQLEKIIGKKELADYWMKPEGNLKLVPTKKAKEVIDRSVQEAFKDVKVD